MFWWRVRYTGEMHPKRRKQFRFGLRELFRVTALVAIVAAVLVRASTPPWNPISVLFPIAATGGILMIMATIREWAD